MPDPAVAVEGLSKRFRIYHQRNTTLKQSLIDRRRGRYEEFWAVKDVSFQVPEGESLGIVGENGSGKSTMLKCIAGILIPERGTISVRGRMSSLLEVAAGFHPEFTGRENIYLNGAILGLPRRYITSILDTIVEFAGLEQFIDNPVKTYSSGMYMRLGFAIAVNLDPDILAIDEVLAVGDEAFQRRCLDRVNALRDAGRTLIFVSHSLAQVRSVCDRCVWMDRGIARLQGEVGPVLEAYLAEVQVREEAALHASSSAALDQSPGRAGVRITGVEVVGSSGSSPVFDTGDSLAIAIEYQTAEPISGARFTIGFKRADGTVLLSVPTDDLETAELALPEQGVVQLRLPQVPFLEGLYMLSIEIADIASGQPYKRVDRVGAFRVHSANHREVGMALLGHRWELPQPAAGARAG